MDIEGNHDESVLAVLLDALRAQLVGDWQIIEGEIRGPEHIRIQAEPEHDGEVLVNLYMRDSTGREVVLPDPMLWPPADEDRKTSALIWAQTTASCAYPEVTAHGGVPVSLLAGHDPAGIRGWLCRVGPAVVNILDERDEDDPLLSWLQDEKPLAQLSPVLHYTPREELNGVRLDFGATDDGERMARLLVNGERTRVHSQYLGMLPWPTPAAGVRVHAYVLMVHRVGR